MPTYEYKCYNCGNIAELIQSVNAQKAPICFECYMDEDKRVLMVKVPSAGAAVHFKGSGFYETDYKGK